MFTARQYRRLVEKCYRSPNNVKFSELQALLGAHGKELLSTNSMDYYYGNSDSPEDSIMIAKKHGTKDGVKRAYVTLVRNYLDLKGTEEEKVAEIEEERTKKASTGDNDV